MDSKPLDVITIGDSTIDTFIKIHDATIECDINREECKICVRYGDKIPVDSIAQSVAGNAANIAAGIATIGLRCAVYTNLGDDSQGELIKKTLTAKGVIADYIQTQKGMHSNMSVILSFKGERTAFVYHQPWFYHLPKLVSSKWVYFTSISQSFVESNIIDEVAHYVDKHNSKLAFGPGTFQIEANIKRYPNTLERCELLICNLEEAKQILEIEIKEKVPVRELLDKMLSLGPKLIVLTDGEEGSYATDGNRYLKTGVFPTKLVEKTGAGDAYASAFISALIFDMPITEAMIWGTINASHVIRELGAQNGLLTRADLERNRKAVSNLRAIDL